MKERLDVLLIKRNLSPSREKAKAIILSGQVFVQGKCENKAGSLFAKDVEIEIHGDVYPYVSRGGLKLEKAFRVFDLSVRDSVCVDVGASTGGFTDCLLQNGAKKVYAIDVGSGQLADRLKQDERVVCREKTNIRYVTTVDFEEDINFSTIDVSFISLTKVLPSVHGFLMRGGEIVALVKPQFEAGRGKVGKRGVVREKSAHLEVIQGIMSYAGEIGFAMLGLDYSPIRGPEGNIEYLLHLRKDQQAISLMIDVETVVEKAFLSL